MISTAQIAATAAYRPPVTLPPTMLSSPNAWVIVQAAQLGNTLGHFATQLCRREDRLEAERDSAAFAGHDALIYRVATPAVDVPPTLLLGCIDPQGNGVVMLRQEEVPGMGHYWVAYYGSLTRRFADRRAAERYLAANPRRHDRDSWMVMGLYVAPRS